MPLPLLAAGSIAQGATGGKGPISVPNPQSSAKSGAKSTSGSIGDINANFVVGGSNSKLDTPTNFGSGGNLNTIVQGVIVVSIVIAVAAIAKNKF